MPTFHDSSSMFISIILLIIGADRLAGVWNARSLRGRGARGAMRLPFSRRVYKSTVKLRSNELSTGSSAHGSCLAQLPYSEGTPQALHFNDIAFLQSYGCNICRDKWRLKPVVFIVISRCFRLIAPGIVSPVLRCRAKVRGHNINGEERSQGDKGTHFYNFKERAVKVRVYGKTSER